MACPVDYLAALEEMEETVAAIRFRLDEEIEELEADTAKLEGMAVRVREDVVSAELEECDESQRSLLVCYFPREANKEMIRSAFQPYGQVDSVYLVHKGGKPACYGFVNFAAHADAAGALAATSRGEIVLQDKREAQWTLRAEWTVTAEVPKKPKKKRARKARESSGKENWQPMLPAMREAAPTPFAYPMPGSAMQEAAPMPGAYPSTMQEAAPMPFAYPMPGSAMQEGACTMPVSFVPVWGICGYAPVQQVPRRVR